MDLIAKKNQLLDDLGNDLLTGVSTRNYIQEVEKEVMENMRKFRKEIIFKRLSELGITINIEQEQRRRFKSFAVEYRDNEESIYYNDGSENGLRVITFVTKQTPFDPDKRSIDCETSYY